MFFFLLIYSGRGVLTRRKTAISRCPADASSEAVGRHVHHTRRTRRGVRIGRQTGRRALPFRVPAPNITSKSETHPSPLHPNFFFKFSIEGFRSTKSLPISVVLRPSVPQNAPYPPLYPKAACADEPKTVLS